MGKWDRRYRRFPRTKHRDYDWSPPRETCRDPESVVWQDNVPMWEKKFCYLVGISWEKVLGAKKFVHCNSPVLDWDDSAGEEAFHSAKERFWAKINRLPCDAQLADPDLYIDKIDWNPFIDPELINDLEREYFNPDEAEDGKCNDGLKHKTIPASGWGFEEHNVKLDDRSNDPWEHCVNLDSGEQSDKPICWNQWDSCPNSTWKSVDGGSWCHDKQHNEAVVDNPAGVTWGESLSWKHQRQSDMLKISASNHGGNPRRDDSTNVKHAERKGWRSIGVNSQGFKEHGTYYIKPVIVDNYNSGDWRREASNDRGSPWERKPRPEDGKGDKFSEGMMNGRWRKRESPGQYGSGYDGLRLHGGFQYQAGQQWGNSSKNKRVSFGTR